MNRKINYDYIRIAFQSYFLLRASLIRKDHLVSKTRRILIINTCLIGDFIGSLPALATYIKGAKKRKTEIDLLVSPKLETLARKMKGVDNVYVAKSLHSRDLETNDKRNDFGKYDEATILRISKEAYQLLKTIDTEKVSSSFSIMNKYFLHASTRCLLKKPCKQYREVVFEMLNERVKNVKFEEIFNFSKAEYRKIRNLEEMNTNRQIVIIHTGSSWEMNMWENRKWVELVNRMHGIGDFRFIFVGGKEEESDYEEISSKLNFRVYSLINKIDICDLMLVLRVSHYFVGVDSGPRNMAHLAELKSVVLLGPGPHMFMPLGKRDIVLDKSNHGGAYQRFFSKKNSFIRKIMVEEVYNSFKELCKK
jgi:ADP-heptose:LPS heptosyltransferase